MKIPFRSFFSTLYHSPTFTTWSSYLSRSLSLVIVLPLVLRNFSPEEITLWYLFSTFIGLQSLVDMGFAPTFARSIAYAKGGAKELGDFRNQTTVQNIGSANWELVEKIWSTMSVVYQRLAVGYSFLLLSAGTALLLRPVSLLQNESIGWISWGIIIVSSAMTFWIAAYSSYLQGVNHIAVQKRTESILLIASIISSFAVLSFGGGLIMLVLSTQIWSIVNTVLFRNICRSVEGGRLSAFTIKGIDREVFSAIWPNAWRSGIGSAMSYGVIQMTGLFYAQVGNSRDVASYLFSLRFAQTINQFSQAPFYTKLPRLAALRSEGKLDEMILVARHGMVRSYAIFAVGFAGLGIVIYPLMSMLNSNIDFVVPVVWSLMAWAFFAERYGAMHIQLYSISNHIVWHIANGISGVINIAIILLAYKMLGISTFPAALLISYASFYSWYAAWHSYREYRMNFLSFEYNTSLFPALLLGIYTLASISFHW